MAKPRSSDVLLVLRGLGAVARAAATTTEKELKEAWSHSSYRSLLSNASPNSLDPQKVLNQLPEMAGRTAVVAQGVVQYAAQALTGRTGKTPNTISEVVENPAALSAQGPSVGDSVSLSQMTSNLNLNLESGTILPTTAATQRPSQTSPCFAELDAKSSNTSPEAFTSSTVARSTDPKDPNLATVLQHSEAQMANPAIVTGSATETPTVENTRPVSEPVITPAGYNQIDPKSPCSTRTTVNSSSAGTSSFALNKRLEPEPVVTPAGFNQADVDSKKDSDTTTIVRGSKSNLGPFSTTEPRQQLKTGNNDMADKMAFSDSKTKTAEPGALKEKPSAPKPVAKKKKPVISENAKERAVPATRLSRLASYGSLAAGLGVGAIAEVTRRTFGLKENVGKDEETGLLSSNPFLTEANAERIVDTLCKVRGAALKLGQMLSIQDNAMINPQLQKIFERVRQSADFMPVWQMEEVLVSQLGSDWRSKVAAFEEKPFAAASIGQVHLAKLHNGMDVAMKIQYPGVAEGIESDINNLMSIMKVWNILPEGLYVDSIIKVAKRELGWEVDYVREAQCTRKFRELLKDYPDYKVPQVVDELSTKQVLTIEFVEGVTIDKCFAMDQETRNHIARQILQLCMMELFQFRFMQTDPNWANFFYNPNTKQVVLLDFGASREFPRHFVDKYLKIIEGAADVDRDRVLKYSKELGFLTGYESKVMEEAHVEAVMILGEAFQFDKPFDFGQQDTTMRIQRLIPVMLNHRLCPPPDESYSLHRKMSGAFLLCARLGAKINCKPFFDNIRQMYHEQNGTTTSK